MANTMHELKEFFDVTAQEFRLFWTSLTDEERDYYKNAQL